MAPIEILASWPASASPRSLQKQPLTSENQPQRLSLSNTISLRVSDKHSGQQSRHKSGDYCQNYIPLVHSKGFANIHTHQMSNMS